MKRWVIRRERRVKLPPPGVGGLCRGQKRSQQQGGKNKYILKGPTKYRRKVDDAGGGLTQVRGSIRREGSDGLINPDTGGGHE